MKDYKYKIFNPVGNKTALVYEEGFSKEERIIINNLVLKKHRDVEQVGFIDTKQNKLEMAGGEFCANATRCAVWELLNKREGKAFLAVSGLKEKIEGGIDKAKEVFVKINISKCFDELINTNEKYNFINLDGIMHAVINEKDSGMYINLLKKNTLKEDELKQEMKKFNTSENAVGIVLLERINEILKIYPIVWVKGIDTLYFETACGSGSLAVAIYKYFTTNNKDFIINQPSGYTIKVNLDTDDKKIKSATISGIVIEEGGIKNGKI